MKRKTKGGIILTSLAMIAVAGSLLAGSTYALFTSESKTSFTVASGKVNIKTTLKDRITYSGQNLTGDPSKDELVPTSEEGKFTNGGSAIIDNDNNTITLTNMTPGDKVTFNINIHNDSTVKSMYRSITEVTEDKGLFDGLIVKINDEELDLKYDKSDYKDLEVESGDINVPVSIELPSDAINIYQDKKCVFAFNVEAIQGNASEGISVTPSTIQSYLDGEHGSIDNQTLILQAGTYTDIDFSRATKYPGSNTDYYVSGINEANKKTFEEFKTAITANPSLGSYYVRNLNNVTIKAADNAVVNIEGLIASSGQYSSSNGETIHDYVLDKDLSGHGYYLAFNWSNIKFEGINFTSNVNICSSQAETSIDGVTFKNCSFTTKSTDTSPSVIANQALRFYSEGNTGKLKGLNVSKCTFDTCYQSIFVSYIADIRVSNSIFNKTGHNAINIKDQGTCNYKKVVIKNNVFSNVNSRIIHFGETGSDTQIVIKGNKATNCGKLTSDNKKLVIEADNLNPGITYDIANNDWGENTYVKQSEFKDR